MKYKEYIDKMLWLFNTEGISDEQKEKLDEIFPQLKESEDKRIRGAIIDHLKDNNLTEWAAWLENVNIDEKRFVPEVSKDWTEKDEFKRRQILRILKNAGCSEMLQSKIAKWLESLKPKNMNWKYVDKKVHVEGPTLAQRNDKSDVFNGYVLCKDHTLTPDVYERYFEL